MYSLQGRFEHILPLLAIRLPDRLTRARPHAQRALEANARALTTPHDLHATILDVLDMRQHWNPYTVDGSAYPRALTMLELMPRKRSCFEAHIEPHYCACTTWLNVSDNDPMFHKPVHALLDYINSLTEKVRALCVQRTPYKTLWVRQDALTEPPDANKTYQVKIVVNPGGSIFEATMSYSPKKDKFTVNGEAISRVNGYWHEPDCIRETHPRLKPYCYCRNAHKAERQ